MSRLRRELPTFDSALASHKPHACSRGQSTLESSKRAQEVGNSKETPCRSPLVSDYRRVFKDGHSRMRSCRAHANEELPRRFCDGHSTPSRRPVFRTYMCKLVPSMASELRTQMCRPVNTPYTGKNREQLSSVWNDRWVDAKLPLSPLALRTRLNSE